MSVHARFRGFDLLRPRPRRQLNRGREWESCEGDGCASPTPTKVCFLQTREHVVTNILLTTHRLYMCFASTSTSTAIENEHTRGRLLSAAALPLVPNLYHLGCFLPAHHLFPPSICLLLGAFSTTTTTKTSIRTRSRYIYNNNHHIYILYEFCKIGTQPMPVLHVIHAVNISLKKSSRKPFGQLIRDKWQAGETPIWLQSIQISRVNKRFI